MKLKYASHGANDLFWFILPLIMPGLLLRYDLNYGEAGAILTLYLSVTALGSFIMGRLSDRMGRTQILSYGFFLAGISLIAAGMASHLILFLLCIIFTAFGVSTYHPVMYALIDESVTKNKGRVLGYYEMVGTASILSMFLINGFLMERIGIKGVLVLTALPALLMGYLFIIQKTPAARERSHEDVKSSSSSALFIFFIITVILRVVSVTAVLNFLPTIFVHALNYHVSQAAYMSAFFFAGGIAGSLIAGFISEKAGQFQTLSIASFLIVPCIFLLGRNLPSFIYPLLVFFLGVLGSGCIINQNLIMARMGAHLGRGEVFGILMGVMTLTSALSPALFGMIADASGFSMALLFFSIPVGISAILLPILKYMETGQQNERSLT